MNRGALPPEFAHSASLLLRYPTDRLVGADAEISAGIGDLPKRAREPVARFISYRAKTELLDLERDYVRIFDTRRRCTLNVSYYAYGDTRRRGIALLRLKRLYAAAGLVSESDELPDYLPLILEFVAFAAPDYAAQILSEQRLGIELLRHALGAANAPHADVLDAICGVLPRLGLSQREAIVSMAAQGPPDEQVGLQPFAPPEVMPTGART